MSRTLAALIAVLAIASAGCSKDKDKDAERGREAPAADTEFCEQAQSYVDQYAEAFDHVDDPQAFEESFNELGPSIDLLEKSAPAALHDDVDLVRQGYGSYRTVLERYHFDVDKVPSQERTLQDQRVTAANQRVENYLEKDCGIGSDTGT